MTQTSKRHPYESTLIVSGTADIEIQVDHPVFGFFAYLYCSPNFELSTDNYTDIRTTYILKAGTECICTIDGNKIVLTQEKGCICNKGSSFSLINPSDTEEIQILLARPLF